MQIDKLPPGHIHLCLSCQAPYTLYYGKKEPDMMYVCHCGVERAFGNFKREPMTATELEERYRILGQQIQAEMCKVIEPFIQRIIKLVESSPLNKTVTTESKEKPDKV
jgi:hypothetical protein